MRQSADKVAVSLHQNLGANAALAMGRSEPDMPEPPTSEAASNPVSLAWSPVANSTVFVLPNTAVPDEELAAPVSTPTNRSEKAAKNPRGESLSTQNSGDSRLLEPAQYASELLKIQVSAAAVLADKRIPLGRVLHITPGTILKFGKSCEQPIELEVGGRRIATGEAVTVGERFGLRITSLNKKLAQNG
jgi:flagellar motor switch protein FliN/FliY